MTAITETFANRGTKIQKLKIPDEQIANIQKYWTIYLKSLDATIQNGFATDIQTVTGEINNYLVEIESDISVSNKIKSLQIIYTTVSIFKFFILYFPIVFETIRSSTFQKVFAKHFEEDL